MENNWIDVKDRLPEEGKEVLVWSDRYGRTFATHLQQNKFGLIWKYSGDPIVTFNSPSHWQPLPDHQRFNLAMDDIKFLKPDKKLTSNHLLIKKAFAVGFKAGIAFMNESETMNSDAWRRKAFKMFCQENKVKI